MRRGIKKSWAQVTKATIAQATGVVQVPQEHSHRTTSAHELHAQQPRQAAAPRAPPAAAAATTPSRDARASRIKHLEAALRALPVENESLSEARLSIQRQIADEKKKIIQAKPFAAQVEGCRGAIARAETRRDKHLKALEEVQNALEAEEYNLSTLRSELVAIESSLAKQATFDTNPIISASLAMTHLVEEMQDSQLVPPEHVHKTQRLITRLLAGMQTVAEAAAAQQRHAAAAPPPQAAAAAATADEGVGMHAEPDSGSPPAGRRTRIRDKVAHSVLPHPPDAQLANKKEEAA